MSSHPRSPWLDVRQAAEAVAVSPRTILRAIKRGKLRAAPVNGRGDFRVHENWLADWMNAEAERYTQEKVTR
jgi:excisionase family DNA binding protein